MRVKELMEVLRNADPDEEVYVDVVIDDSQMDIDVVSIDDLGHCVIIGSEDLVIRPARRFKHGK